MTQPPRRRAPPSANSRRSCARGGSIGAVLTMRKTLDAPVTFLGLSLPEHGYHAINENFDWGQASGGMELFCRYFSEIADRAAQG